MKSDLCPVIKKKKMEGRKEPREEGRKGRKNKGRKEGRKTSLQA